MGSKQVHNCAVGRRFRETETEKTYEYALLVSTLALSTNFGLRRITLTVQGIPCFGISLHVDGIETRIYHKKIKKANGNELFEEVFWGIVVVVVRRHGASESAEPTIHHTAPNTVRLPPDAMTSFIPLRVKHSESYTFPLWHYS